MPESLLTLLVASVILVAVGAAGCGPNGGALATYTIEFSIGDSPADLNTLNFHVGYSGGDFVGLGSSVSCKLLQTAHQETATFKDNDTDTLTIKITATNNPLAAGDSIVTCDFSSGTQPVAADFTLTVDSATDDSGNAVTPTTDVKLEVTGTDLKTSSLVGEGNL